MKQFKIYQAPTEVPYVFSDFGTAFKRFNFEEDYKLVCEGVTNVEDISKALDDIFEKGNKRKLKPIGKMRSVSMSDIIEIDDRYFYTEAFGFREITKYL